MCCEKNQFKCNLYVTKSPENGLNTLCVITLRIILAFSYEIKHPVLVTGCFLYIFVQILTAGQVVAIM
nr:MAG TPA: hypothetical protein [Caudoviricetes sp.]